MSRHEGVSCDSCLMANFRGRRYKCLICYDYDLCAACYEGAATNTRHTADHPMQCILTRSDFDFFYGGEALSALELPQSYTCPYCARMGFTDVTLQEHVSAEHADSNIEVVCPLCAAMPGGDPNLMTDDFAGHLSLEHRTGPRDLIAFLDEPVGSRHNVRRIPHTATHMGRGAAALRPRRSNMHFSSSSSSSSSSVFSSSGISSLSPSSRDSVDPIAELLSQLSGVRRSASSSTSSGTPTQLQQLQMQLQVERQQVNAARQQLERFPRRQTQSQTSLTRGTGESYSSAFTSALMLHQSPVVMQHPSTNAPALPSPQPQYLLTSLLDEMNQRNDNDLTLRQERSLFVQELALSSIVRRYGEREEEGDGTRGGEEGPEEASGWSTTAGPSGEESRPARQGSGVLRGRARSDALNSRRRAEANNSFNKEFKEFERDNN